MSTMPRMQRVKLYWQILDGLKKALDAWWRLQFGDAPPEKGER